MPTDAAPGSRELREALVRYLRERPDAADTLVGIAQWWLPATMRGTSMAQLRRALAELIAANEMRCTTLPDGSELYSRAVDPDRTPPNEPDVI
jgi:hypothetical protein